MILSVFLLIVYIGIGIQLLRKSIVYSYFSLFFMYSGAWVLVSLIFNETFNVYMSEIDRVAYLVYSVPVFFLFSITTVYVVRFFAKYFSLNFKLLIPFRLLAKQELGLLNFFFWGLLSLLMVNLLLSPIPLFDSGRVEGIHSRFDFWQNARFPILSIFGGTASFLVIIAGMIFVYNYKRGLFMLLIYLVYIILMGHKFGTLITIAFYFFMPYVLINDVVKIRVKLKHIVYLIVLAVVLFSVTLANYSKTNPYRNIEGAGTPLAAIFYRGFALQSQLTWVSIEQHIYLGQPPTYKLSELSNGMLHLMNAYHGSGVLFDVENHKGSTLTVGYPAILIHTLPLILAYLLHFIFVMIFGVAIGICILFLRSRQYILVCMLYMFIQQFLISLFAGSFKNGFISMAVIFIIAFSLLGFRVVKGQKVINGERK